MPDQYFNPQPMSPAGPMPAPAAFYATTALQIAGFQIVREFGIVYGIVARSLGVGRSFTANLKTLVGGEIKQYTTLVEDSRRHALDRMIDNAKILGANAVISFRFDSSEIVAGVTEVIAYGTAVFVTPLPASYQP